MITRFFNIIALVCLMAFSAFGQLSENSKVFLLTCAEGDEIYAQFGHSALRIVDAGNGIDQCYNWGMFEFGDDEVEFNLKFARGKLDYYMAIQPTSYFLGEYQYFDRAVVQQELNLNLEEKNAIWNALEENYLPENRFYKYDFFFDNCASRIRDILIKVLGDKLILVEHPAANQHTYREIIDKGFANFPWTDFGIDLVLGYKIDVKVDNYNLMFNPLYMDSIFENSQIDKGGVKENFVLDRTVLVKGLPRTKSDIGGFSPMILTVIILCVTLILAFFKLTIALRIWNTLIFFLLGILGLVLVLMWVGTDHIATKGNLNIIWANPLWLFLTAIIWIKKVREKLNKTFIVLAFTMFGLILFFLMLPQEFHVGARVMIITLAMQFYFLYKETSTTPDASVSKSL